MRAKGAYLNIFVILHIFGCSGTSMFQTCHESLSSCREPAGCCSGNTWIPDCTAHNELQLGEKRCPEDEVRWDSICLTGKCITRCSHLTSIRNSLSKCMYSQPGTRPFAVFSDEVTFDIRLLNFSFMFLPTFSLLSFDFVTEKKKRWSMYVSLFYKLDNPSEQLGFDNEMWQ